MQRVLLAVEAYAPDDMGEGEISQDVYLALRAALASGGTQVEASHVKTMMTARQGL
jgi:hypothetical protein